MSIINFYRKQTVLNDIFKNQNIVIVDNSQLNTTINSAITSQYGISNTQEIESNVNYQNSDNYLTKLYMSHYNVRPPLISNVDIIENIKRYNNCSYNSILVQDGKYKNYDYKNVVNSLLLNYTYNKLYYVQYDKINLMSYLLDIKNGFNYDYNNHILYFNIDNQYIRSVNNTLYYNFNRIRETSFNDIGITLLDDNYINTKNVSHYKLNNSKYHGVMNINKDFKYNTFITLNKLRSLYYKCEDMYNTLSYYASIDDYNNDYFDFIKYNTKPVNDNNVENKWVNLSLIQFNSESSSLVDEDLPNYWQKIQTYYHTAYDIKFQDAKICLTDKELGIYNLDISDEDTIYISDLNNVSFSISTNSTYITSYNYTEFKNDISLKVENNNINYKLSYILDYKYLTVPIKVNFLETSTTIFENQSKSSISQIIKNNIIKYPYKTTYNIIIGSDIDKNIFNNSGLTIQYQSSPYLNKYMVDKDLNKSNSENISYSSYSNYSDNNKINYWTSYIYDLYNHDQIILSNNKELNIRKINGKVQQYYKSNPSCHMLEYHDNNNEYFEGDDEIEIRDFYYVLSSKNLFGYYDNSIYEQNPSDENEMISIGKYTIEDSDDGDNENKYQINIKDNNENQIYLKSYKIRINKELINELKSKKLFISKNDVNILPYINKVCYYKILTLNGDYEYYPILNSLPNKYLNDKFFDAKIYKSDEYSNLEELDTCVSEIKNIYYDNIKNNILYLYEILYSNDGNDDIYELVYYSIINEYGKIVDGNDITIKSYESDNYEGAEQTLELYYDNEVNKQNIFDTKTLSGKDYGYWYLYRYLSLYLNHSIRLY